MSFKDIPNFRSWLTPQITISVLIDSKDDILVLLKVFLYICADNTAFAQFHFLLCRMCTITLSILEYSNHKSWLFGI